MKDSWIMQVEQLKEWKDFILQGEENNVLEQIEDILNQIEEENKNQMFKKVKTTFLKEDEDVFGELEKLLKEILIGKEIKVCNYDDNDLLDWIEEYNKPLIVTDVEVDSWGLWVKDCPYRVDLSEYYLYF